MTQISEAAKRAWNRLFFLDGELCRCIIDSPKPAPFCRTCTERIVQDAINEALAARDKENSAWKAQADQMQRVSDWLIANQTPGQILGAVDKVAIHRMQSQAEELERLKKIESLVQEYVQEHDKAHKAATDSLAAMAPHMRRISEIYKEFEALTHPTTEDAK